MRGAALDRCCGAATPSTSYPAQACSPAPRGRPSAQRLRLAQQRRARQPSRAWRCRGSSGGGSGAGPAGDDAPRPGQQRRSPLESLDELGEDAGVSLEKFKRWAGLTALDQRGETPLSDANQAAGDGLPPKPKPWGDWDGGGHQDWDEWSGPAVADLGDMDEIAELREEVIARRRRSAGRRSRVRDEYLRPIVDVQGIYNRLNPNEAETEQRVFVEAITNQYESRVAVQYLAVLVGTPLAAGFLVSRLLANPLWDWAESLDAGAFALRDEQKVEGAHHLHAEELRLRMEAAMGLAPPLTDEAMVEHLRHEAKQLEQRCRASNRAALLNAVSDSISAGLLFALLLRDTPQRQILFRSAGRIFVGLSDTAKAFLIILITDTLLGYHSEEGWTTVLHLASGHYGMEAEEGLIHLFVAVVPVCLDTAFKYWIFIGLNKEDPAAAVTLRQMDRH